MQHRRIKGKLNDYVIDYSVIQIHNTRSHYLPVWKILTESKQAKLTSAGRPREELRCLSWLVKLQRDIAASVDQRTRTKSQPGGTEGQQRPVVCSHQVGRTGSIWSLVLVRV